MINLPAKPLDSCINIERGFNRLTLSWESPRGGFGRYALLAFLCAWMCGWVLGEFAALFAIFRGQSSAFLFFWLAGWTFGGVFCGATIFRLIQPSRPERISFDSLQLEHDPGTAQITWSSFGRSRRKNTFEVFKPRRKQTFAKREVGEIRLDRVGERQRLSFDCGAKRIEVGEFLEEPEREWLYTALKSWKSA